jgi:hypothetical protein
MNRRNDLRPKGGTKRTGGDAIENGAGQTGGATVDGKMFETGQRGKVATGDQAAAGAETIVWKAGGERPGKAPSRQKKR